MKKAIPTDRLHIAAAYARYSTSQQHETSIVAQLKGIEEYCEKMQLPLLPKRYIDEAFSGTNTDQPGFIELLRDAQAGMFDTVVVYDVSRGSRDVVDWFSFRKQMAAIGVTVLAATNTLGDPDDPNAFFMELMTVGFCQHMVLQSRQKSIAGKKVRAERGLFCGGVAPLGYDIDGDHYVINEKEAEAVGVIFRMYAQGASFSMIIDAVKALGVTAKSGRALPKTSLHSILTNERYTGKYIWFENENRHMHKWVGKKNDDPVVIENAIPRIVDQATWDAVKHRMDNNKRVFGKRANGRIYMLGGLIKCGQCGSPMTGVTTTSKGYAYKLYACSGKRDNRTDCTLTNIKAEPIEKHILQTLQAVILNPDMIAASAAKWRKELMDTPNTDLKATRKKISEITNKLDNLIAAIEGGAPAKTLLERIRSLETEKALLEAELTLAENDPSVPPLEEIIYVMELDAKKLLEDETMARHMITRYVESVTVYEHKIEIAYTPTYWDVKKRSDESERKSVGSPSRARTYNNSVNSRVLYH